MPLAGGLQTRNQCRRLLQSPAVQSLSSNHLFLALGRPPQYPSATHSVGLSLPSGLKVTPPTHISHHQQFRVVPTYKTSQCNDISGASRVIGRNLESNLRSFQIPNKSNAKMVRETLLSIAAASFPHSPFLHVLTPIKMLCTSIHCQLHFVFGFPSAIHYYNTSCTFSIG